MTPLPLAGITVVSIEQAVAAPLASRHLADLGARVIKVEPPQGDFARRYDNTVMGQSSYFVWLNRSKESLALDLADPGAHGVLKALIARADVLLHNLGPGVAKRYGLDANLREQFPALIHCAVTGYGQSGPFGNKKAYDLLIQCEAGLVAITGTSKTPTKVGISVADIAAGMYAFSGILAGLLSRHTTGAGMTIEVSLFDALVEWMGAPMYYSMYSGRQPRRSGAAHATIAPYGPFRTADRKTVFLAVQNEREWENLCRDILLAPELATDLRLKSNADRIANRALVQSEVASRLGALPARELVSRLDAAKIANARLNPISMVNEHPQLSGRNRWRTVKTPAGIIRAVLPVLASASLEPRMDPVPEVGEHNAPILAELGLTLIREASATRRR